ncbi:hypothetical protein CCR75_009165 [Bremia lactucae]|uniref:Uncharacterized protein n=1 Tax=Bremia lactucae TaxID=4779 RepID=A0A976IGG0_BRELC|nr:hypothetical protein CCR75_009165 [Bremia lactucae]
MADRMRINILDAAIIQAQTPTTRMKVMLNNVADFKIVSAMYLAYEPDYILMLSKKPMEYRHQVQWHALGGTSFLTRAIKSSNEISRLVVQMYFSDSSVTRCDDFTQTGARQPLEKHL